MSEGHIGSSGSSIPGGGCQGRGLGGSHKIADFMDLSPFVKESNPNPNLGACLRGCTATHATPRGFCPNSVVLRRFFEGGESRRGLRELSGPKLRDLAILSLRYPISARLAVPKLVQYPSRLEGFVLPFIGETLAAGDRTGIRRAACPAPQKSGKNKSNYWVVCAKGSQRMCLCVPIGGLGGGGEGGVGGRACGVKEGKRGSGGRGGGRSRNHQRYVQAIVVTPPQQTTPL